MKHILIHILAFILALLMCIAVHIINIVLFVLFVPIFLISIIYNLAVVYKRYITKCFVYAALNARGYERISDSTVVVMLQEQETAQ